MYKVYNYTVTLYKYKEVGICMWESWRGHKITFTEASLWWHFSEENPLLFKLIGPMILKILFVEQKWQRQPYEDWNGWQRLLCDLHLNVKRALEDDFWKIRVKCSQRHVLSLNIKNVTLQINTFRIKSSCMR